MGGGGRGYPREIDSASFPLSGAFDFGCCPFEDRENLEISLHLLVISHLLFLFTMSERKVSESVCIHLLVDTRVYKYNSLRFFCFSWIAFCMCLHIH